MRRAQLPAAVAQQNPLTIRANIRRLQRVIREQDVQLVHAHSRAPAWSACYAARRCRCRSSPRSTGSTGQRHGILKRRYNAIMARGDRVIAVSDYVAEHVRRRYGVPDERLRVIHRGIDIRKFDPDAVDRQQSRGPGRAMAGATRDQSRPAGQPAPAAAKATACFCRRSASCRAATSSA